MPGASSGECQREFSIIIIEKLQCVISRVNIDRVAKTVSPRVAIAASVYFEIFSANNEEN